MKTIIIILLLFSSVSFSQGNNNTTEGETMPQEQETEVAGEENNEEPNGISEEIIKERIKYIAEYVQPFSSFQIASRGNDGSYDFEPAIKLYEADSTGPRYYTFQLDCNSRYKDTKMNNKCRFNHCDYRENCINFRTLRSSIDFNYRSRTYQGLTQTTPGERGYRRRGVDFHIFQMVLGGTRIKFSSINLPFSGDRFSEDAWKSGKANQETRNLFTNKVNLIEKCLLLIKTGMKHSLLIKIGRSHLGVTSKYYGNASLDIKCSSDDVYDQRQLSHY